MSLARCLLILSVAVSTSAGIFLWVNGPTQAHTVRETFAEACIFFYMIYVIPAVEFESWLGKRKKVKSNKAGITSLV